MVEAGMKGLLPWTECNIEPSISLKVAPKSLPKVLDEARLGRMDLILAERIARSEVGATFAGFTCASTVGFEGTSVAGFEGATGIGSTTKSLAIASIENDNMAAAATIDRNRLSRRFAAKVWDIAAEV
jgi:hypothetical protein